MASRSAKRIRSPMQRGNYGCRRHLSSGARAARVPMNLLVRNVLANEVAEWRVIDRSLHHERREERRRWCPAGWAAGGTLQLLPHLTMAGVPQRTVMAVLGHRNPRMTMRYQHFTPGHLPDAVRALDTRPHEREHQSGVSTGTMSAPAHSA